MYFFSFRLGCATSETKRQRKREGEGRIINNIYAPYNFKSYTLQYITDYLVCAIFTIIVVVVAAAVAATIIIIVVCWLCYYFYLMPSCTNITASNFCVCLARCTYDSAGVQCVE